MKRSTIIILALVALLAFYVIGKFNGLSRKNEDVENAVAKMQTQYQRRSDLVPNLVRTVQGVANFEKETLTGVIEARAKATSIQLKSDDLSPEKVQQFQQAQEQLGGSLSRLMVAVERYPELKANQNFSELQAELAGTENRISVARNDFNTEVKTFNQYLVTFPNNLISNMLGFKRKAYFEASAAAQNAPVVDFGSPKK